MIQYVKRAKEKLVSTCSQLYFSRKTKSLRVKYILDPSISVLSVVSHDTLNMYLIAISTFMKQFGKGTIAILNDGTLSDSDIIRLKEHLGEIVLREAKDIETFDCPSYISWKRLFFAMELAKTSYVIQLDSDTISLNPHYEISDLCSSNTGFVIGSPEWGKPVNFNFLSEVIKQRRIEHVQTIAEENFINIPSFDNSFKYLRGCAGFAGYPKDFTTVKEVRSLSKEIEKFVGPAWEKWGSEQTMTLYLISKTKTAKILPWPYYQNYKFPTTNSTLDSIGLIHFIGTNRYTDFSYIKAVRHVFRKYP